MNDRNEQGGAPGDRDRVVDGFFAAHRDRVVEHPVDDETWQVIREHGGRGGGLRGMWFLGGAVAASAVAVAVLVGQGLGGPDALPPAGPGPTDPVVATGPQTAAPSVPTETRERVEEDAGAPAATAAPTQGQPSPETFSLPAPDPAAEIYLVREPSGEDGDLRTTTYDVDCPAAAVEWHCPGLAVSEDGGATWTARVDMFEAGYYAAVSSRERTWMWAAFGGDRPVTIPQVQRGLVRSDDGGRTWRTLPTRGEGVLWVEAFRSTLVVVTAGCEGGSAEDCVEVVFTDVAADDATTGRRVVSIEDLPPDAFGYPQPLPEGGLQATFDAVYLHLPWRGVSYRIADGQELATPLGRPGCEMVSTAPESPDTLLAHCQDDHLEVSGDGGATWQEVTGPGGDVLAVSSNDGQRLAVATDEALWVRDGGGSEWERVLERGSPAARLDALGGASMVFGGLYRSYDDADPEASRVWTTEDDWRTWTEQPPIEVSLPD